MIGSMTPHRPTLIADAAIALIAERGLRGLTHRAVDEEAGLPAGSTSNLARTRAALLDLALARIVERETEGSPVMADALPDGAEARELLVHGGADLLHRALTVGRTLTLARLELALEATRRPELRAGYDRLGARFTDLATALLARCGSADAPGDARRLIRWCDGVLFNSTAGSGHDRVPTPEELRGETARYLAALLDHD
ncbi:TetR/AcrR family transcriptional regulator [Kitasatospora purpeofusca]|uniref:TetR/AcrR family transcriptional regulator n=1 Tax=Kitasatospora purpeofusca TaxID=67352 RepID=A0ABZ1TSD9_9ACTN|nr:TetR/AcrR family transcriptional regulator [Kitasatospora purpeofusca]